MEGGSTQQVDQQSQSIFYKPNGHPKFPKCRHLNVIVSYSCARTLEREREIVGGEGWTHFLILNAELFHFNP